MSVDCHFTPPTIAPCVAPALATVPAVPTPLLPIPCIPSFSGQVTITGKGAADMTGSFPISIIRDPASECGLKITGTIAISVPTSLTAAQIQAMIDAASGGGGGGSDPKDPNAAKKNGDCAQDFNGATFSGKEYTFGCCQNNIAGWWDCGCTIVAGKDQDYQVEIDASQGGKVQIILTSQGPNICQLASDSWDVTVNNKKAISMIFSDASDLIKPDKDGHENFVQLVEIDMCEDGKPKKAMVMMSKPYQGPQ